MSELIFKGKEFVYNHHLSVPFRPLVPQADKSIGEGRLDGNLIIHGDNLHALKALLPMYARKIDCIVIDPPYNTGHEGWCYNDNVNSPMVQEWLNSNPVGIEDGLRHDKWCAMMFPRLRLLKELLSENGYIAATIDSNEIDRMLCLMDEIFGSKNRLAIAVWLSDPSGGKQKSALRTGHEYIVIYGGNDPDLLHEINAETEMTLTDKIGNYAKGRELNKWGSNSLRENRPSMFYRLLGPDGSDVWPIRNDGKEGCWRFGQENRLIKEIINDPSLAHWDMRPYDSGVVIDGKTERWVPYEKIRDPKKIFGWSTWLDNLATNADGTKQIKEIFGDKIFDTPKPLQLMEWLIGLCENPDAIILDSFAGSGTTAHSALNLNKKDGGHRKFILVECEVYADNLTAERVRRVINGYDFKGRQSKELMRVKLNLTNLRKSDTLLAQVDSIENREGSRFSRIKKEVRDGELIVIGEKDVEEIAEGLGGSFTYCTLGEPIELDRILAGENLPSFESLGSVLFHMATSQAFDSKQLIYEDGCGYLGESSNLHVWLIYKPDLEFLKSPEAALTLSKAKKFTSQKRDKRHIVFAPARFVSRKILDENNLPLDFAPLPFALYRISTSDILS